MDDKKKTQQDTQEEVGETQENATSETVVREEFDALQDLAGKLENQYKRAIADYQNLQRRVQEEKSEWIRTANKDLILKLLDVLDTLMLAQKHLQDPGLGLSIQKFLDILQKDGVTLFVTLGLNYDPALMNVVSTKKVEKDDMKGKVVEEVTSGFMQYDKILRAANVIVGE